MREIAADVQRARNASGLGDQTGYRPVLIITATDLSLGTRFEFTEQQFHQICSNIETFPLAIAVAASNSVPILFTPITLKNYASLYPVEPPPGTRGRLTAYSDRKDRRYVEEQNAYRNVQERPYIHLVDGGLADNLGIKPIIDSIASSGGLTRSLQSRGVRGIRRLVLLNVDAGRSIAFPADRVDSVPSSIEVARGIQFGLLSHYAAETRDAFAEEIVKWRREIRIAASEGDGPFAPDTELYYIEVGLRNYPDQATRTELMAIPRPTAGSEALGYPTQKPLALLERIIGASSNEGDVVLDPFCGCGTAVHAAEKLKRQWVGIDVTHLAVSLIEKRMRDAFPGIKFDVHGTPKDLDGARNLAERDKYQFQWWACSLVNAQPYQGKKKGADSGIDGLIYFHEDDKNTGKIVVSVKGGENVTVKEVRDLRAVIEREKAAIGFFVTLNSPTKPMVTEAAGAGFYSPPMIEAKFPRLQILTIEGLLNGKEQPRYPHMTAGGLTFKKAKAESTADQKKLFER